MSLLIGFKIIFLHFFFKRNLIYNVVYNIVVNIFQCNYLTSILYYIYYTVYLRKICLKVRNMYNFFLLIILSLNISVKFIYKTATLSILNETFAY